MFINTIHCSINRCNLRLKEVIYQYCPKVSKTYPGSLLWDEQWHTENVLWSDESRFQIVFGNNSHHSLGQREKGPSNIYQGQVQKLASGVPVAMAWINYVSVRAPLMQQNSFYLSRCLFLVLIWPCPKFFVGCRSYQIWFSESVYIFNNHRIHWGFSQYSPRCRDFIGTSFLVLSPISIMFQLFLELGSYKTSIKSLIILYVIFKCSVRIIVRIIWCYNNKM